MRINDSVVTLPGRVTRANTAIAKFHQDVGHRPTEGSTPRRDRVPRGGGRPLSLLASKWGGSGFDAGASNGPLEWYRLRSHRRQVLS